MAKIFKAQEFVDIVKGIAKNNKTLYVYGCFGAPMSNTNKNRYSNNYAYNAQPARTAKIKAASADTFGFDCVNLIKGVLWGWKGDKNKTYGGAVYASNGVPDTNANGMMNYCSEVSSNFSNIELGEVVHLDGHIGVYIGDGLVVECTPIWKDGVQITGLGNIGGVSGYNNRTWSRHGKLDFIDYSKPAPVDPFPGVSDEELAARVWAGEFGNNPERREALGIRYEGVQALVDKGVGKPKEPEKPVKTEIAEGDTVIVNGVGTASSDGSGAKTRHFENVPMKVIGISGNTSRPNRYALNQYNRGNIRDWSAVTGWFREQDITKGE
jgi:hypothetical protein